MQLLIVLLYSQLVQYPYKWYQVYNIDLELAICKYRNKLIECGGLPGMASKCNLGLHTYSQCTDVQGFMFYEAVQGSMFVQVQWYPVPFTFYLRRPNTFVVRFKHLNCIEKSRLLNQWYFFYHYPDWAIVWTIYQNAFSYKISSPYQDPAYHQ